MKTISDLTKFDDAIGEIKRVWDPDEEMKEWAEEARIKQVQWVTEHRWNGHRREERVHPSSLEKKCDNYLYLELLGAIRHPKKMGKTTGVFDMGTACHLVFDYLMESRAFYKEYTHVSEFKVEGYPNALNLRMCGSADGYSERVISDLDLRILWELKSASKEVFSALGSRPKKQNLIQSHAYAWSADIPIIVVVYMNKNNGATRSYIEEFSPALWRQPRKRVERLVDAAMSNTLITSVEKHVTKSCRYCDFLEECGPDLSQFEEVEEGDKGGWLKGSRKRAVRKARISTQ